MILVWIVYQCLAFDVLKKHQKVLYVIQNGLEKTKTVVKDGKEVVSKKKVKIDYLDAGSGYGAKATIAVNNDCMKLSPYGWE